MFDIFRLDRHRSLTEEHLTRLEILNPGHPSGVVDAVRFLVHFAVQDRLLYFNVDVLRAGCLKCRVTLLQGLRVRLLFALWKSGTVSSQTGREQSNCVRIIQTINISFSRCLAFE